MLRISRDTFLLLCNIHCLHLPKFFCFVNWRKLNPELCKICRSARKQQNHPGKSASSAACGVRWAVGEWDQGFTPHLRAGTETSWCPLQSCTQFRRKRECFVLQNLTLTGMVIKMTCFLCRLHCIKYSKTH